MGRLWIGIGLLLALLAIGIGMLAGSGRFFQKLSDELERSCELALSGNWQAAGEKARQSQQKWDSLRRFFSAFTDHEPVEQMQNLFARLEIFYSQQMPVDFAVACQELAHLADAIRESHSLFWWSLL